MPATALPLPLPGEGLLQGSQIIHDVNPGNGRRKRRPHNPRGLLKRAWPRWAAPELPGVSLRHPALMPSMKVPWGRMGR